MLAEWTEKSEGKLLSSNTKEVKLCDFFFVHFDCTTNTEDLFIEVSSFVHIYFVLSSGFFLKKTKIALDLTYLTFPWEFYIVLL